MRIKAIVGAVLLAGVLVSSAAAQPNGLDDQPIMRMLAQVPQGTLTSHLTFSDRAAITQAYPEAQMPTELEAFFALDNDDLTPETRSLEIWWRVFSRYTSSMMAQSLMQADTLPTSLGLDFFQVQQELSFGQPPENTLYLAGTWDAESVRAALASRNYSLIDENAVAQLWCEEDCLTGSQVQMEARDPGNPFGGNLGQNWPLLVADGQLIGSRSEPLMRDYLSVANGDLPTLAQDSLWRAAVTAATQEGILLQAKALRGEDLRFLNEPLAGINVQTLSPEQIQRLAETILEDYVSLPPFQLLLLADTVSEGQQVGKVILTYAAEADARAATEILPGRMRAYVSLVTQTNFTEILTDRNLRPPTVTVQAAEGVFTVVIDFSSPQLDAESVLALRFEDPLPEGYAVPGSAFALLAQSIFRQDIGWLSSAPREALEALAGG
jgi:hypothetical protein